MYFPDIPCCFIFRLNVLDWYDVLWGYEHGVIDWKFIVNAADYNVSYGSVDPLEIELICMGEGEIEGIEKVLIQLAERTIKQHSLSAQEKWLYVVLKWVYENRASISDPLAKVELIYEDYGFPTEMECFVRYMPASGDYDSGAHSVQENTDRLFDNWSRYLQVLEFRLNPVR